MAAVAVTARPTAAVEASLRRLQPTLDPVLARCTAPPARLRDTLAQAVALAGTVLAGTVLDGPVPEESPADAADAVVRALLERACGWAERGAGPERTALEQLAGPLSPWLRADPGRALAQLAHAATVLDRRPGALEAWGRRLAAAAAAAHSGQPEQLRALGALAAWRSGLVQLRAAAHALAPGLPGPAVAAALELTTDPSAALAANAADPWAWPGHGPRPGELRVVARSGGFTGFGGPYPVPPVVLGGDGARWRVRAGGREVLLLWDVHGEAVQPAGATGTAPTTGPRVAVDGWLHLAGASAPQPWQDTVTGSAVAGRTAVLSRAGSHLLDLVRAG